MSMTHPRLKNLLSALVSLAVVPTLMSTASANQRDRDEQIAPTTLPLVVVEPVCPGPGCPEDGVHPDPAAQGLRTIFLNFDGVTINRTFTDDARKNESRILRQNSIVIPPLQKSDLKASSVMGLTMQQIKDMVVDDVRYHMHPYNVNVVTERPSSGNYHMVVMSGQYDCETVAGTTCAGIAPLDCYDANGSNVVWTFAKGLRVSDLSTTASHETAHALGVHHTNDNKDIMYPSITPQIPYAFGAGEVPDGRACSGESFQDSNAVMVDTIGSSPSDTTPPDVLIAQPLDGLTIGPGSVIEARVDDRSGTDKVELHINGELYRAFSREDRPWTVALPPVFSEGPLVITARAWDAYGNQSEATVNVTYSVDGSTPCTVDEQCFGETACRAGVCTAVEEGEGSVGWACSGDTECNSGICANDGTSSLCTQTCDAANTCPEGFDCVSGGVCWPAGSGGDSGGCAVSSPADDGALGLLFLAGFFALGLRRKQR